MPFPKDAIITTRTFPEVESMIAEYARREKRSMSQMVERLLREAVITRLMREKKPTKAIDDLP
jgi:hypothetical protein